MSLANQILKRVGTVNELLESAKTAEKARVDGIISMAANIFKVCIDIRTGFYLKSVSN